MYQPSKLHDKLHKSGLKPKKSLSQNFLVDGNILRKILKTAEVTPQDVILEIGPGAGALTHLLLESGAKVIAVERDEALAKALAPHPRLQVIVQDILDFSFDALPLNTKLVANIPYHITTPILEKLFASYQHFQSATLLVQKEVAERICAKKGGDAYGALSLFVQFYAEPKIAFIVSPHCFYPKPSVASAVIHLQMRNMLPLDDREGFHHFVRRAFGQRRKMLRASLKEDCVSVEKALQALGLNPKARPEELGLDEFVAFYIRYKSRKID